MVRTNLKNCFRFCIIWFSTVIENLVVLFDVLVLFLDDIIGFKYMMFLDTLGCCCPYQFSSFLSLVLLKFGPAIVFYEVNIVLDF